MTSATVTANLTTLAQGSKWQGYFDGLGPDGAFRGWALLAADPDQPVTLDLHICNLHVATTATQVPRMDIARRLGRTKPLAAGFIFSLSDCEPAPALALLRQIDSRTSPLSVGQDIRVCIGGTQHTIPLSKACQTQTLDRAMLLSILSRAAALQLRTEVTADPARTLDRLEQEIIVRASALFAPGWYAATYGDVEMSGLDPAEHFLRLGGGIGRAAGAWFQTERYLAAEPQARASDLNPLVHYELHGSTSWWPGQHLLVPDLPRGPHGDHALLIHLYHLDTVPDLQRVVARFAKDTDVYVSIPEGSQDHDPAAIAALFPRAQVMTVPNQGQDIGAFLEVVRRIKPRGYRFFCKIHSKKGDKFPDLWRRHMFDAVAATPERIEQVKALFRRRERMLLVGPSAFWFSGNDFGAGSREQLDSLSERLGLGPSHQHRDWGYFAGACFWINAGLATALSEAVPQAMLVDAHGTTDDKMLLAAGQMFGLAVAALGGEVARTDGRDWFAAPIIGHGGQDTRRLSDPKQEGTFVSAVLQRLRAPLVAQPGGDTVKGVAENPLHREIDVMISCWNGRPEPLHDAFPALQEALDRQGMTSALIVSTLLIQTAFEAVSCANVMLDSLYFDATEVVAPVAPDLTLDVPDRETLLDWLRAVHLFKKSELPDAVFIDAELERIATIYRDWRAVLTWHKVKLFLIWGDTAPKSRMLIHLCKALEIEYFIIERGHFPGTLAYDPSGQFGDGARAQFLDESSAGANEKYVNDRFSEIVQWYSDLDSTAYAHVQKRETADLARIRRARQFKRPVILVIGGNDMGAGLVKPGSTLRRTNWFGTSNDAFDTIFRLLATRMSEALLVLRPHPSQNFEQQAMSALVARDTNLNDLIAEADVCIVIGSTSRAICLLHEKPLITLGLSELSGRGIGHDVIDENQLLAVIRRLIWSELKDVYPDQAHKRYIVGLFDRELIAAEPSVPARFSVSDLAELLRRRVQQRKSGFLLEYNGDEGRISHAMYEDIRERGRAVFRADPARFEGRARPGITLVLPIYGDYEGTRVCFDQLIRHQKENGYKVITVWDRGPDLRLRDLCLEYAEKGGFLYMQNAENVGFSGAVNEGILRAGRDDVILLNSDTVPCGDWALRLQDAAYAHPKIASVVPFSNNATIYNVPFPNGRALPAKNPVPWAEALDMAARRLAPDCVEMPISHGYCTYVRRSMYDLIGLYSEMKFGKGQSEDNEFSLRARMAGYFCVCATNVLMSHAGSTSFGTEVMEWKLNGRRVLREEFSHYFDEISHFFKAGDPAASQRARLLAIHETLARAAPVADRKLA